MKTFIKLIATLKRLPGIGPKQAERMALFLLRAPDFETENLINALRQARAALKPCESCCDYTEGRLCRICADPERERAQICVVEEPQDVAAIERCRSYRGLYHVLHGSLSPLDGIGPEMLRIEPLMARLRHGQPPVTEVILATDPDTEGEATALYLLQLLKPLSIKASRIAHGVPLGGDLDYIDERTLSHALSGRRAFS
jgi:recombination protein RecR